MNELSDEFFRRETHRLNLELQNALKNSIFYNQRLLELSPKILWYKLKFLVMLQVLLVFLWPFGACVAPIVAAAMLIHHQLYMRGLQNELQSNAIQLAVLEKEIEAETAIMP